MRCLILNPPSFDKFKYIKEGRCESRKGGQLTPPITLGILSSLLSSKGYEPDLFDFMAEPVSAYKFNSILSKPYDVVFVSTSAPTFEFDKKTVEIIKLQNNKALVCSIGVLGTALPELLLKESFDVVILGEPEHTALEIVETFQGKINREYLSKIKGIAYKHKNKIIINKKRELIENLDVLPFPDRDKMPTSKYISPRTGKPFTVIKVQRGCPYSCSFCTASFYYGNKSRYRSVSNIIGEIKLCISKYNLRDFLFLSDTFTINHAFVNELCNEIVKQELKITWSCNSRIDTFSYDLARNMKKAGCWLISFGVESGSKRVIKENSKNLDPNKAISVAKVCKKVGINSMMYYILGFPKETKEEIEETITLALKVKSNFARFFVATPLPGSELYTTSINKDNLSLNALSLSDVNANMSTLSNKELKDTIRKAYLRYYLRPGQIYRTLSAFSKGNFLEFITTLVNYAKAYFF